MNKPDKVAEMMQTPIETMRHWKAIPKDELQSIIGREIAQAVKIDALKAELTALRKRIADAPHGSECAVKYGETCNCWKQESKE